MKPIRWGILGTGAIAKAFAEALKETEGKLVAVASNIESRAMEFCDLYDCSPILGYQNLISHPEIDAVYIATPHPSHFELSAECLRNQKQFYAKNPYP